MEEKMNNKLTITEFNNQWAHLLSPSMYTVWIYKGKLYCCQGIYDVKELIKVQEKEENE